MMPTVLCVSPFLVPIFGIAVAFIGYRKNENVRAAETLSAIAIAGGLIAALGHEQMNGYTMAVMAGMTGVTMLGYAAYHRRRIY
jgi:hypothetical protein